MTDGRADAAIAVAVLTARVAARVRHLDAHGERLADVLDAMAGAMWRGASVDELIATLTTMRPVDDEPGPLDDVPTPAERPSAVPRFTPK